MNPTPYRRGALDTLTAIRAMRAALPPGLTGSLVDLDTRGVPDRVLVSMSVAGPPRSTRPAALRAMLEGMDESPTLLGGLSAAGAILRWASPHGCYVMHASADDLRAVGLVEVAA